MNDDVIDEAAEAAAKAERRMVNARIAYHTAQRELDRAQKKLAELEKSEAKKK